MAETKDRATRLHDILDRVIAKFSSKEEEQPEVSLEEVTMPDGTVISYESKEVGSAVMVIPEEGEPAPAPDGEYPISEMETLVVADGVISEVKEAEEAPEEEVVVEESEEVKEELEEEPVEETKSDVMGFFNPERFKELVDLEKEGFYTITFSVSNGAIDWGNLYSESFTELSEQKSELEKEVEELKAKFEEDLKLLGETIKSSGLIQAPVEKKVDTKLTKADITRMRLEEQRKEKSIY